LAEPGQRTVLLSRLLQMKPKIDTTEFGSITVDGTVFDHEECEIVLLPTPQVIGIWNETEGRAVGLFHVTC
jgi:hypothetical protein